MHLSEGARILARKNQQIQSRESRVSYSRFGSYPAAALALATFACGMLTQSETADAVPSFARQTGYYCSTCHTAQPELTPFGRQFKLNGYTQGGTRCGDIRKIFGNSMSDPEWSGANLSSWILPTFNHFAKPLPGGSPAPGLPANDILDFSDATVFYNGQIYCNLGIFSQFSYGSTAGPNGVPGIFWDNTELRYTDKTRVSGNDVVWGILGNNNPSMQDVWNTVPAWLFPWVPQDIATGPSVTSMLESTQFAGRAQSAGAYVWVNNMFYAELSAYRAFDPNLIKVAGGDPSDGTPRFDSVAPYWRLAIEKTWNEQSLEVGTYGMYANVQPTNATVANATSSFTPTGVGVSPGSNLSSLAFGSATDKYTDVAVDAQYQYIGPIHAVTVRTYYLWEHQQLDATYYVGNAFANAAVGSNLANRPTEDLRSFNISASYIYDRHISLTGAYFNIQGNQDTAYYAFSPNGKPNTDGFTFDLSYIPYPYGGPDLWPWLNARIGVLYTHFDKLDGTTNNVDGNIGYRARDADQTFLYAWIDF